MKPKRRPPQHNNRTWSQNDELAYLETLDLPLLHLYQSSMTRRIDWGTMDPEQLGQVVIQRLRNLTATKGGEADGLYDRDIIPVRHPVLP
jgi:hypothetical protein